MRPVNLDPNDPTVRVAVFGQQVQDFLSTPIGDYLLKKSQRELEAAFDNLKKADPFKPEEILALQLEIKWAEHFQVWLGGAVQDGINAEAALEGERAMEEGDAG